MQANKSLPAQVWKCGVNMFHDHPSEQDARACIEKFRHSEPKTRGEEIANRYFSAADKFGNVLFTRDALITMLDREIAIAKVEERNRCQKT